MVCLLLALIELFPRSLPQNLSPALSFFVVPVELPRKLPHLAVEPEDFDIGEGFAGDYEVLDRTRQDFFQDVAHIIQYYRTALPNHHPTSIILGRHTGCQNTMMIGIARLLKLATKYNLVSSR